jgi:hypothetical protein
VEQELYNGAVGTIVKIVYADKQGPNAANAPLPAYVVVDFPFMKIPTDEAWDKKNPTWVPVPPTVFRCNKDCCTVTTMALRIHKATSVHKGQGISCGKGKPDELVVVGLGGERGAPGLDLVALSRATEIMGMAIYDDISITREQLFKIGRGKGYDKKREFESKLGAIQAKTVPPMIALITSQDHSKDKSFSGGCRWLIEWFHSVQDVLPPPENALEKATKIFLDSLTTEPPTSDKNATSAGSKLSVSVQRLSVSAKKPAVRKSRLATRAIVRPDSKLHGTKSSVVRKWFIGNTDDPFHFKKEIEKIGQIEDVSPDGNCGFHAVLLGLEKIGKIERRSTTVTGFRKVLYEYARTNEMEIRTMVIPDCQNSGIGKEFAWSTNVLDPLFRVGTTYENGCDQSSWISGEWHFPLIAYKYQSTIVIYGSDTNTVEGELYPRFEKRTIVFFPNGEQKWLSRHIVHPRTLSVDMASTIFLVHKNGNHFLHLSVPINIQGPPDDDESVTEEPEQAGNSIPLLVDDGLVHNSSK